MKELFAALALIMAVTSCLAASTGEELGWRDQSGRAVKNTDDRKSIDGFGASVIITRDADWEQKWTTPAATTPKFTTTDRLEIGQQGTILIFFANPKPDANGSVDVTCDIKITRPDNSITENDGAPGFTGKLASPPESTFLSQSILPFVGEATDPVGEWLVEIKVHDNVRQVTVPLKVKFKLEAGQRGEAPAMSEGELTDFMTYYYVHPSPGKVPQAVQAMHDMGHLGKEAAGAPIAAFLSKIFQSSPTAIEGALAGLSSYQPAERKVLFRALWLADTPFSRKALESSLALKNIKLEEGTAQLFRSAPPKVEQLPVESPDVLDMLWGAFLATGDEKYVLRVISALPYLTQKGDFGRLIVGRSARWSLASNAVQHKHVLEICVSQLERQPKEVRSVLSEVISEAKKRRTEVRGHGDRL